jgi:hypothetical protein
VSRRITRKSSFAWIAGAAIALVASLWLSAMRREARVAATVPANASAQRTGDATSATGVQPRARNPLSTAPSEPRAAATSRRGIVPQAPPPASGADAFAAQYAALLEGRFAGDRASPDSALETELRTRIQKQLPPGSRLESVACRQSLCRVLSLHPDGDAYRAYVARSFGTDQSTRVWPGQVWVAVPSAGGASPPGAVASSVYLGRSEELPR